MRTRLAASAGPKIAERVGCLTTPGETIDAVGTGAGVVMNLRRAELRERLVAADIEVVGIGELHA